MEAKSMAYKAAEQKVKDGTISAVDIPDDDTAEKDFDYIVKYATILHVLNSSIFDGIEKNFQRIVIEPQIPKVMVDKAYGLVTVMRLQQKEYTKVFEDVVMPIHESVQFDHVTEKDAFSLEKIILTFPGKVVSTNMIIRKHRRIHARSMQLPRIMSGLGSAVPGLKEYVGQYKSVAKKHCFYKASPENVDKEYLAVLGITEDEYRSFQKSRRMF